MGVCWMIRWSRLTSVRYAILFVVSMVMLLSYHSAVLLSQSQLEVALRQENELAGTKKLSFSTPKEMTHAGLMDKSTLVNSKSTFIKEVPTLNWQSNGSHNVVSQKPSHFKYNKDSISGKLNLFKTVMTQKEKTTLMDIAKRLDYVTQQWNITYFLYGGALLGSYRHHDIIPWDDDLDVFVSLKHRYALFRAISTSTSYEVFLAGSRMKMWSAESRKYTRYPWGWPYVDISFYDENDTHIWDSSNEYKDFVYPKSIVFPLHKRPLAGYFFKSPMDSFANLRLTYKTTDCASHHYSHKYEKIQKNNRRVTIPCDLFSDTVPFVHRSRNNCGIRETLKLREILLQTMIVNEPSYAISEPYSLVLVETEVDE